MKNLWHCPQKHNRAVTLVLCFQRAFCVGAQSGSLVARPVSHHLPRVSTKHCQYGSNIDYLSLKATASPTASALPKTQHMVSLPGAQTQNLSLSKKLPSATLWPLTNTTALPSPSTPLQQLTNTVGFGWVFYPTTCEFSNQQPCPVRSTCMCLRGRKKYCLHDPEAATQLWWGDKELWASLLLCSS